MSRTLIRNVRIVFPGERTEVGSLLLEGGRIAAVHPAQSVSADATIDGDGRLLAPGLVDIHVHGIEHFAFDNGPDDLLAAAGCFARFGTTTVLPTLVPLRGKAMLGRLSAVAEARRGSGC